MALTPSTMLELGTPAPGLSLPDPAGRTVSLDDFKEAPALVVAFICNHCPYVKHVRSGLVDVAKDYRDRGIGFAAVSSNDAQTHPEDGPDAMAKMAKAAKLPFPYLYDATQDMARAYRAACTPDFFVFDAQRRLVYRGRLDGATPGNTVPVTGADLRAALDALLQGKAVPENEQQPSIGCNIKWAA